MNLSIIIVSYNTKELLGQCLKSITNHPSPTTEIIVVDNGSSDGSVDYVKNIMSIKGTTSTTGITGIRLIENGENCGFAKAVNQALRQVQGEAVLLLNSDTMVKEGALGKLLEFEKQVRPAIIGAKMLNPDGTVQGSCFHLPTIKRAILEFWLGKKNYFSKYAPSGNKSIEVEAVSGGAMIVSKKVIDKIGLFDERYFMYFEDLDFCRRAKRAGFKIYYLPTAKIIHEHGASGKKLAVEENQWRRLIPSSKTYHGSLKHYIITLIIRIGQKCQKFIQ